MMRVLMLWETSRVLRSPPRLAAAVGVVVAAFPLFRYVRFYGAGSVSTWTAMIAPAAYGFVLGVVVGWAGAEADPAAVSEHRFLLSRPVGRRAALGARLAVGTEMLALAWVCIVGSLLMSASYDLLRLPFFLEHLFVPMPVFSFEHLVRLSDAGYDVVFRDRALERAFEAWRDGSGPLLTGWREWNAMALLSPHPKVLSVVHSIYWSFFALLSGALLIGTPRRAARGTLGRLRSPRVWLLLLPPVVFATALALPSHDFFQSGPRTFPQEALLVHAYVNLPWLALAFVAVLALYLAAALHHWRRADF